MDLLSELHKVAITPQGTATAPQGTATAPQGTATAPQGTATAPMSGDSYNGGQADIIVQKDKILKVYKHDCGFNAAVLALVKSLKGKGFVVDLYDYGTMEHEGEQRAFELMAYYPKGAISALNLKGDKDSILKIVRKVATALDVCHRAGFIHKDVKPANILIRDKNNWDCVLCDFGIADMLDHGKVTTQQSRTPVYAAPEVYERTVTIGNQTYCELTPAADFYSLGMTILCLWYGEAVFRNKESVLAMQKVHDGIVVPTDMPDPLYTITRGLLIKDPAHRWGLKEINDFLNGKSVDVYDEFRQNGGLNIIFNSSKHQIAHSPEELAAFMADDLSLSIKYLYSGKISKWLEHIPELQIEIENIVEKDFPNDQKAGVLAAIHTLNPFYDIQLCCDIHDPGYAMTGDTIGKALNEVYLHYFSGNNVDTLDIAIAESFLDANNFNYVPWFLDHKGSRFTQQRKWFNYCVFGDSQNSKKAGPKDTNYLHQVAMMKTIAGFGAQPEYRLSRTGEVLKSLDDVRKVPKKELLYDLQNDKGLRGWLAVLCQENPHIDLKKKFRYEKLLEQYTNLIGYIDPSDDAYKRFRQAQAEVQNIVLRAKHSVNSAKTSNILQKLLTIFLGIVPLSILLIEIILNISDNPITKPGDWTEYLVWGIGLLSTIIYYLTNTSDGCFVPFIVGVVTAVIAAIFINVIAYIILYIYLVAIIVAIIYFSIAILFNNKDSRKKIRDITNPGFEEMTLEPLYFAFNDEKQFDSSLNGTIDIKNTSSLRETMRKKWKIVLLFLGCVLVLMLLRLTLPESERMERFDQSLKKPFITEKPYIQDDEVQTMPDPEP